MADNNFLFFTLKFLQNLTKHYTVSNVIKLRKKMFNNKMNCLLYLPLKPIKHD